MQKGRWNFYIDILMFFCMAAIAGLGFLMKYVLLPGKEAWASYGKKVDLTWLGLDRHAWGAIHLYLGFVLLGLLVLHLVLHWQLIVSLWQKYVPAGRFRSWATVAFLLICGLLFLLPFFIRPEVADSLPSGRGESHSRVLPQQLQAPAGHLKDLAAWPRGGARPAPADL